ncbi:MAG: hypothetical protein WCL27_13715 [Betaproteobacteria bacterium]
MNKLIAELQRLYFLQDQQWQSHERGEGGVISDGVLAQSFAGELNVALNLLGLDGQVRAMVLCFDRAADWERVAQLYQVVEETLELPAPAISVSAESGYKLWLSLAESVPLAQAQTFLQGLCRTALVDLPISHFKLCPGAGEALDAESCLLDLAPALHPSSGKWSAFIDPAMGSMFVEAPGLEMAPNMDRQADILSRLKSIKTIDFQRALSQLKQQIEEQAQLVEAVENERRQINLKSGVEADSTSSMLNLGSTFSDPKSFLLAVMNDSSATASQRIEAAKALLPYFENHQV